MELIFFKVVILLLSILSITIGVILIISDYKLIKGKDFSIKETELDNYFWDENKWIYLFSGKERKSKNESSGLTGIAFIIFGMGILLFLIFSGLLF